MAGYPPRFGTPNSVGAEGSVTADTDIDIINTALSMLGQSPISAFGENVGAAVILQSAYNRSRDDLLRRQPWNFARQWIQLNVLQQAPPNLDILPLSSGPGVITYTGAYILPNKCLRVFRFSPRDANWRIIGNYIFTDATPMPSLPPLLGLQPPNTNGADNMPTNGQAGAPVLLGIEFIYQESNPVAWDANFRQCFVWKLAKEISFGVTGLAQAYQIAKVEYDDALAAASTVNGLENWPDPFWNTDLVDVRYGYVSTGFSGQ